MTAAWIPLCGVLDSARGDGRRAPVGGFAHVDVHEVVGVDAATDGDDTDGVSQLAALFQHLHDEAVSDAVRAAGAIAGVDRGHTLGDLKYRFHFTLPPPAVFSPDRRSPVSSVRCRRCG